MQKIILLSIAILFAVILSTQKTHAQASLEPVLYNKEGQVVNGYDAVIGGLNEGWYYSRDGRPLYYYPNGVYYNPESQTYGGSVVYPDADGPRENMLGGNFVPGVPNTGAGGNAFLLWVALVLSGTIAVLSACIVVNHREE